MAGSINRCGTKLRFASRARRTSESIQIRFGGRRLAMLHS
jgi:hypothetical protein